MYYRIFLASSNELADDRIAFGDAIQEINDSLLNQKKTARFALYKWERETASFFERRKQDEYNLNIETCDLFVMLYWSKVGKYTEEEYDFAYQRLVKSGNRSPVVFVYQKNSALPATQTDPDRDTLVAFNAKVLGRDGQFRESYTQFNDLRVSIEREINKLFALGILSYGEPAILLSPNGVSEPTAFLGREDELEAIRERLEKGGRLMLINAEGGIGKTTLAAKYWHESLHHYKHNAWLFCENGIINALKDLAPQLNLDLAGMDEAQQLAALKHALKAVHSDCLLVLDNANDENEIRVFKQEFEGFHWHVLLTSRCAGVLDKSQELPITHLPPPLAKELFVRNYQEDTPEFTALLDRLLLALQYHTLSIELFSKNMRELSERGGTLAEFVKHLETEGLFLGKRSFSLVTDYTANTHLEARNSDEILDRFYNFARLDDAERYWLVNMALLPAEDYAFLFLCDLFTQDTIEFETLHQLARKGWLTKTGSNFRLSPVIQSLALKKNEATLPQDAEGLLTRLNQVLENDGYNILNIDLTNAAPYVKPVEHLSKCLDKYPGWAIASYNFSAGVYYDNIGDLVATRKCHENYNSIYQNLLALDPEDNDYKNGLAISYSKLGGIYEQTGDWQNALTNYQEDFRITKEIYESSPGNLTYKNGLAISYSKLGGIYEQTGEWQNALTNYQEQNRIGKEIYESSPGNLSYKNGLAISYLKLAGVFFAEKNTEASVTNYLQCCQLFKEIVVATRGQLVSFVYNFSWTCDTVTDIVKQHKLYAILDKASLRQMRQEGYAAIKPLAEAGILQANRMGVYRDLGDESWYAF